MAEYMLLVRSDDTKKVSDGEKQQLLHHCELIVRPPVEIPEG